MSPVAHLFLRFVQKGWGWFSLASVYLLYGRMVRSTRKSYCLTFTENQYTFWGWSGLSAALIRSASFAGKPCGGLKPLSVKACGN